MSVKRESQERDAVVEHRDEAVLAVDKIAGDAIEYRRLWYAARDAEAAALEKVSELRQTVLRRDETIDVHVAKVRELQLKLMAIEAVTGR